MDTVNCPFDSEFWPLPVEMLSLSLRLSRFWTAFLPDIVLCDHIWLVESSSHPLCPSCQRGRKSMFLPARKAEGASPGGTDSYDREFPGTGRMFKGTGDQKEWKMPKSFLNAT